jgi:hypothetical protein
MTDEMKTVEDVKLYPINKILKKILLGIIKLNKKITE